MGFFKKLLGDAADGLKKNLEDTKKEMSNNLEEMEWSAMAGFTNSASKSRDEDEDDDEEPKILLGDFHDGVLIIREGITELDDESLEHYKCIRKIIFPASLERLDSNIIDEQERLEELDFSKVTKLKTIPDDFISGENKIRKLIIPNGVTEVGDGFLGEAKSGAEIFVPASVRKLGYITGNNNNDMTVYLFAANIDISDVEQDVKTLYVLPDYYGQYAKKLKDCDSEVRLREMPGDKVSFYGRASERIPVEKTVECSDANAVKSNDDHPSEKETAFEFIHKLRDELVKANVNKGNSTEAYSTFDRLKQQYNCARELYLNGERSAEKIKEAIQLNLDKDAGKSNDSASQSLVKKEPIENGRLFSARLEALIAAALQDGVLTDKEREILKRRVEKEGEDWDEVEMIIEARLAEMQSALPAAQATLAQATAEKDFTAEESAEKMQSLSQADETDITSTQETVVEASEESDLGDNIPKKLLNLYFDNRDLFEEFDGADEVLEQIHELSIDADKLDKDSGEMFFSKDDLEGYLKEDLSENQNAIVEEMVKETYRFLLHKKWDADLPAELIDLAVDVAELFDDPYTHVDYRILRSTYMGMKSKDIDTSDIVRRTKSVDSYVKRLLKIVVDGVEPNKEQKMTIQEIAQIQYDLRNS